MFLSRCVRENYFLGLFSVAFYCSCLTVSLREITIIIIFCLFILSGPQGSLEAPAEMPRRAVAAQAVHNHAGEKGIPMQICFLLKKENNIF